MFHLSVTIKAIFDIWIVGDHFLKETAGTLQAMMNEADMNKEAPQLYINKYYNILPYFKIGEKNCIARVINSLIEALSEQKWLPRFLVFLLDKDV